MLIRLAGGRGADTVGLGRRLAKGGGGEVAECTESALQNLISLLLIGWHLVRTMELILGRLNAEF